MNAFHIALVGGLGALIVIGVVVAVRKHQADQKKQRITDFFKGMKVNNDYEESERPHLNEELYN